MEEKENKAYVRDPKLPPVNMFGPVLPHHRSIADAYADVVLSMAYYGKMKERKGNLDSHMDEVPEGTYEI